MLLHGAAIFLCLSVRDLLFVLVEIGVAQEDDKMPFVRWSGEMELPDFGPYMGLVSILLQLYPISGGGSAHMDNLSVSDGPCWHHVGGAKLKSSISFCTFPTLHYLCIRIC